MLASAWVNFGLGWNDLKRISPRRFAAMVHIHEANLKRSDAMTELMLAQVVAKIHNTSMGGHKHPVKPEDFMPSHWLQQREKEADKLAIARQAKVNLRAFLALRNAEKTGPSEKR